MAGEVLRPTAKTLNETFTETLQFWNGYFATQSSEACKNMANEAVSQLDQLLAWQGVLHEPCVVNGQGIWSEAAVEVEHGDLEELAEDEANMRMIFNLSVKRGELKGLEGMCRGFIVLGASVLERPELYYLFETTGWQMAGHGTFTLEGQHRAYVKPENSTIVPVSDFETPFVHYPNGTVLDMFSPQAVINSASGELMRLVSSTGFRRQKRQHQEQAIDAIIQQAETKSLIKEANMLLEPQYGYIGELTASGEMDYIRLALGGLCVEGTCLGLTMLGKERLSHKAIRRDTDVVNKRDGISMSIEVKEPLLLNDRIVSADSIVHIPLSGQDFECIIELNEELYTITSGEGPGQTEASPA
ncbi:MAG TPA: hypothetical protein VN778_01585 [Verrucomicrobiae bacterium]|nr:hypothetical protein [Verrucomicrobiae bacterium]